ncbi:VIT and vWA domain-containing protein [Thiocapsa marina]|uniref:Vault protein inter-alpha-trypsin domain-containing protein n=1 Tax=Thiocapsa marina 5811 TaxID=768671 RepID=F9UEI4_9GAMM|nr:VIT and VWA domain-containing protein [Thiocapsa marina]EGV17305.1 Vault protein inter-alpha-trypsin domain-containing protein [Thiocapsa marina 5811]
MYRTSRLLRSVGRTLAVLLLTTSVGQAAGLLTPSDGSLPALSIRDHQVDVLVQDGYAVTTVEQVFHNPHDRDLEATYSFPVPEHGTVAELTVWIDGKPVSGEVLAKERAEEVYQSERAAGRDAGIAVKDAYRTFDIRVAPVRAVQDTRVRFVYLQPIGIDHGIGRYVYPLEEGGVDEAKLAFWTASTEVQDRFRFDLRLRSGYPVEAVRMPNASNARIEKLDAQRWDLRLSNAVLDAVTEPADPGEPTAENEPGTPGAATQPYRLDKDLVVYWRLAQDLPGSLDLVTYKPDPAGRGTFLLTLTPGDDLQPISQGTDWVFVLDLSGSMQGKYGTLAEGIRQALGKLRPEDRFRIVTFNNSARELTRGYVPATAEGVLEWADRVAAEQPNGGTDLYSGLQLGLDRVDADRTSGIILVTDGVANVGETEQRSFLRLIEQKDVRLFTFIMGNSANRPLLEALTQASDGFARSVSNADDIVGEILAASSKLTHAALHGIRVEIDGVRTTDLTPSKPGSLYRGQQLMLLGHYWGDGEATLTLSGRLSGAETQYRGRFAFPARSTANPELERLWAYDRIREMEHEIETFGPDADMEDAVRDLGVAYGLVTDRTSMVVLREEVFEQLGIERLNATRSDLERAAREQRTHQVPTSPRVDQTEPMFTGNRATHAGGGSGGGAGALSPWEVAFMLLGVAAILLIRARTGRRVAP